MIKNSMSVVNKNSVVLCCEFQGSIRIVVSPNQILFDAKDVARAVTGSRFNIKSFVSNIPHTIIWYRDYKNTALAALWWGQGYPPVVLVPCSSACKLVKELLAYQIDPDITPFKHFLHYEVFPLAKAIRPVERHFNHARHLDINNQDINKLLTLILKISEHNPHKSYQLLKLIRSYIHKLDNND